MAAAGDAISWAEDRAVVMAAHASAIGVVRRVAARGKETGHATPGNGTLSRVLF